MPAQIRIVPSHETRIGDALAEALQDIERAHGVRITNISAEWVEVGTMLESRSEIRSIRFEASAEVWCRGKGAEHVA